MTVALSWLSVHGKYSLEEKQERVLVTDVNGREWRIPVHDADLFIQMLQEGGAHESMWYVSEANGMVKQSAFASVERVYEHVTRGEG